MRQTPDNSTSGHGDAHCPGAEVGFDEAMPSDEDILRSKGPRYDCIRGYLEIDGWLTPDEAAELYDLAAATPDRQPTVVEIGAWVGKSSLVLAKGVRGKDRPTLICIDPFNADGDDFSRPEYEHRKSSFDAPLLQVFSDNMRRHSVLDCVRAVQGYSHDVVKGFREAIDLLFIDGNHECEAVRRDILDWSPLVKRGGMLVLHDVGKQAPEDGPQLAMERHLLGNAEWEDERQVDSLFIARKSLSGPLGRLALRLLTWHARRESNPQPSDP